MKNLITTPKKSVLIIPSILNNKKFGKSTVKRLPVAYIYGLLRRTINVSLNNPNNFYSKKFHAVYCVNKIKTLMKRANFSHNIVTNALKLLKKYGYIKTHYLRSRHVNLIFMPKIKGTYQNPNVPPTKIRTCHLPKSERRCNEYKYNEYKGKYNNSKISTNSKNKRMVKWIKNYDYPDQVNELLKACCPNLKESCAIASNISNIKVAVNKHNGVYNRRNMLFSNKTNQYIQNNYGLYRSIRKALSGHKNITTVVSTDYEAFVKHYMATAQRNQHYTNRQPIKQKLPKWARNDYKPKLHPTSKAMQKKIEKQLKELDSRKNKKPIIRIK